MNLLKMLYIFAAVTCATGCAGAIVANTAEAMGALPRDVHDAKIILSALPLEKDAAELHDVSMGSPVFVQRITVRNGAKLLEPVAVKGATLGDADMKFAAGALLVSANDGNTERYYCAEGRRPGLVPITMWACFEDTNGDGRFDLAGQAPPDMGSVLPILNAVHTMNPVDSGYQKEDLSTTALWELAFFYERMLSDKRLRFSVKARAAGETKWRDPIPGNIASNPISIIDSKKLPQVATLMDASAEVTEVSADGALKARALSSFPEEFQPGLSEVKRR